jgi:hypothetical protein
MKKDFYEKQRISCSDMLLSPESGVLAFSLAEVDAPPEYAEGWDEEGEGIPSTANSGY